MEHENLFGLRKFVAPEFIFGWGARELLGQYAKNFAFTKALVVTDPGVIAAGWAEELGNLLQEAGIPYSVFSEVTPNPREHEVMKGAEFFAREKCNALIAIGGGSPIDTAKGIGIVISNGGHILDYEGVDMIPSPIPPLICIPTTAGSSADVSQFAIISDTRRKTKIAIISKALVPDVALVDPETTTTMTPSLTANTAMDVLSHAIESVVSNASSPITDLHALEAIRLLFKHLPPLFEQPGVDMKEHRSNMMLASLLAGLAFSNASLGAIHAMAHSLGGLKDSPHGECNALLVRAVVDYNFEAAPEAFRRIGEAMGLKLEGLPDEKAREAILGALQRIKQTIGIRGTLADLGIQRSDIPELAAKALQDPCLVTNPRQPTLEDLESIYERAF